MQLIIKITNQLLDENLLEKINSILTDDGLIVYPTETAYGLGCNALSEKAVNRIFEIKKRPIGQPLSVIVPNIEILESIALINPRIRKLIEKFHPGPLVISTKKKPIIPDIVNKQGIAFRISSNKIANQIATSFSKPIISTSANLTATKTPYSIKQVLKTLSNKEIDLILDVGILEERKPSTLIDFQLQPSPQIIRIGEITAESIFTELSIPENKWNDHLKFIK